jgi:hypothetical protein
VPDVTDVNRLVFGVVNPIGPGDANVAPFNAVAFIVPVPDAPRLAPLPTTIAAVVLVALVIAENAGVLVPQTPPPVPSARQWASGTPLPFKSVLPAPACVGSSE